MASVTVDYCVRSKRRIAFDIKPFFIYARGEFKQACWEGAVVSKSSICHLSKLRYFGNML